MSKEGKMATFEQAFYMPGQGFEVLKYLHYHEAQVLKGASKCCRDAVTKFAGQLVNVFSYNNEKLTFNNFLTHVHKKKNHSFI